MLVAVTATTRQVPVIVVVFAVRIVRIDWTPAVGSGPGGLRRLLPQYGAILVEGLEHFGHGHLGRVDPLGFAGPFVQIFRQAFVGQLVVAKDNNKTIAQKNETKLGEALTVVTESNTQARSSNSSNKLHY